MNSLRIIPDEMLQEITSAAVIPTLVRNIREMWDYIRKRSGDRMVIPFADRLNTLSRDELLKELLHYTCKPVYSAAEAALKEKMEQAILYRLGIAHADIEVRIRPTPIVTEENEAEWSNYLTKLSRPCPLCESGLMNPTSESYYTNDDNYCWVLACDKCSCSISFVEPQDNRGGADMVQFNGTQCVNYQSLESALEAHAEDIPEQFDKASGFEHFCRQLGRLVGDECTPKCPHYKYNKSLQHQYAGLLDNAFKLDIEIVFCGNCGIWFGVQSDALETSPSWSTTEGRRPLIRCPDCGEGRAVDGLPEEPVEIESLETFVQQIETIESILCP